LRKFGFHLRQRVGLPAQESGAGVARHACGASFAFDRATLPQRRRKPLYAQALVAVRSLPSRGVGRGWKFVGELTLR
jgi:hypothetical protein